MTMRMNNLKAILKAALRVVIVLPFAAVVAFGQQTINLTAAPTTTAAPDGTVVPMWGYFCGALAANTPPAPTCAALNPASQPTVPNTLPPVPIPLPTAPSFTFTP